MLNQNTTTKTFHRNSVLSFPGHTDYACAVEVIKKQKCGKVESIAFACCVIAFMTMLIIAVRDIGSI